MTLQSGRYAGREYIMLLAVAQALNFTVDMVPPFLLVSDVSKRSCIPYE